MVDLVLRELSAHRNADYVPAHAQARLFRTSDRRPVTASAGFSTRSYGEVAAIAALTVLSSRHAIVIGPTPPGTGVHTLARVTPSG